MGKFTLKQIAAQSGLSLATIDRALHHRGRVHPQTEHRIQQAIADLELLRKTGLAQGRTLYFDIIMHTPDRFSELVREAFTSQIASFGAFRLQLRFHCHENMTVEEVDALLKKCALNSHGIILKAINDDRLIPTLESLSKQRIPIVTVVTDMPASSRLRYIGMDNISAGKAAAFLMSKWLRSDKARIAAVIGSQDFVGEQERIDGFIAGMAQLAPQHQVKLIAGGFGIDQKMYQCVHSFLTQQPDIQAVYTVGGGNAGILRAFDEHNIQIDAFIGHDLDRENRALMQAGRIDALIDHNLQQDAQQAFRALLEFHGFLPETALPTPSSRINIITRFTMYT
ncbi:LacI family DNA-binding transcriptional regulator [Erwinia sp. S63]|uniref:substrate-binding domain-containing protein n=1 Tax=Erwinia sp. S63 TaxID=2769341 RepID=UPI00190A2A71|nr:substrate-binding domain-containing protein [Erwinia sp. S63]MBK0096109.1 LacI family DNA-binding transcriptional regulator [Erwinia sp. S63]